MAHSRIARRRDLLVGALLAATLGACAHGPRPGQPSAAPAIVDRPIPFTAERLALTRAYIHDHYGLDVHDIRIVPKIITLHWTAVGSFQGSYNTFVPATLGGSRPELARTGDLNVGIQFLVDRDGTIYRLQPELAFGRHVIGLNYNSIGVENVGGASGVADLTVAQIKANIALVRYLAQKYPTIQYLIGHYEYREFEGHPLWLERDSTYRTGKVDPGPDFMEAVRAGVSDLHLKGVPEIRAEKAAVHPAGS